VVSLLAASRRPESVLSLTLIEPPLFAWVDDEAARAYHSRLAQVVAEAADLSPSEFWVEWARAGGRRDIELPAFTQSDLAAITTTMRERTPWDAEIPLAPVASAAFPKLVCLGGRGDADPNVKRTAGRAYAAVCRGLAERIGADLQVFEHSSHNPQIEEAPAFNQRLRKLWEKSSKRI
jgi:pimeloyl-ACP methyl ester carboxylesterase